MSKKRIVRGLIIVIVVLLILVAGAALLLKPKRANPYPDFSAMPTDTAGYNMIGNLPENLAAGGFMAGQNGWIYFSSFSDSGKLYMCRENGADMTKLTDFAVSGINVLGSSVVFTSLESKIDGDIANVSGGKLYVIYGLHSSGKTVLSAIDPDTTYFSPYLDRDGLYVSYSEEAQSALANKLDGTHIVIQEDMGQLQEKFSFGNLIYAQMSGGKIVRLDAKSLLPLDSINGRSLHRIGNSFIFHGEDGFIYELIPADRTINPISSVPVDPFIVNAFNEIITAPLGNSAGFLVITKRQLYGNVAEMLLPKLNPEAINMQNGWYSYKKLNLEQKSGIYFNANGKYYSLNDSEWSADWLNVKLDTAPLVSLDDVIVEDLFTPPWLDFSEDMEPIDPADSGDFGSERPVRPTQDNRADAASDVKNALDAAILLLLEDESIADKYTGESVEKLRNRYGDAFKSALDEAASGLAANLSRRLGMDISIQEAQETIVVWLRNTNYEIGGVEAASNGKEAGVLLTAQNAVNLDLLYSAIETGDDVDSAYAVMLLEPPRNSIMSSEPESAQIYMRMESADCWIAESPDKLIKLFIRGLDERSQA